MNKNLTQKLEITFKEIDNIFELWIVYYDLSDVLYPEQHRFSIAISEYISVLHEFAKKHHSDIYNPYIDSKLIRKKIL